MPLAIIQETLRDVVAILESKIDEWGAYVKEKAHNRLMDSDALSYENILAESKEAVDIIHTVRSDIDEIKRMLLSKRFNNSDHELATIVKQCIDITDTNVTSGIDDINYNSATFQLILNDWNNLLVYLLHSTNI